MRTHVKNMHIKCKCFSFFVLALLVRKSSRLFLQAIFAARLSIVSLFYKLTEMKSALRSVHRIHQYCNAFLRSKQKNNLAIHPPTTHSSSKSLTMRFSLLSLLLAYGNILFVYLTQLLS